MKSAKIVGFFLVLTMIVIGGWWVVYPGQDPKGFEYIGWRLGLPSLNPDLALGSMIGDVHRDGLVIGKTRDELVKKFGYVTEVNRHSAYWWYCYFNSPYYGKDVLILRRSNWMVVMKDGRAEELVLLKGC